MNHNSLLPLDSGSLWPYTGSQEDQDDVQRLLESPTALATQYNYFSSRLGGLDTFNDGDPLRQNSLVRSPDFTRALNMAGMFDAAVDAQQQQQQQPGLQRWTSLHRTASSQPELLQQLANAHQQQQQQQQQQQGGGAQLNNAEQQHMIPSMLQMLQQRQQQRIAHQNQLREDAPTSAHRSMAPAQQQQRQHVVRMPAIADLPVSPRLSSKARRKAASVLKPAEVAAPVEQLPKVPVVTYAEATPQQQQQQQQQQQLTEQKQASHQEQEQQGGYGHGAIEQTQHVQEGQQQPDDKKQQAQQQPKQQQLQQQQQRHAKPSSAAAATAGAASRLQAGGGHAARAAAAAHSGSVSGAADASAPQSAGGRGVSAAAPRAKGSLVWAKFPKFPWWPAVIIGDTPSAAAADESASGPSSASATTSTDISSDVHHHQQQQQQHPGYVPGSVLVRFLGTYDAAWVEPGKALSQWGVAQHERASKTKAASFVAALKEASQYLQSGTLPEAFGEPPQLVVPPVPSSSSKRKHKETQPSPAALHAPAAEQQQQGAWSTPAAPGSGATGAAHAAAALQLGMGRYSGASHDALPSSSMGGSSSSSRPVPLQPAASGDVGHTADQASSRAGAMKRKAAGAHGQGSSAKRSKAAARH